MRRPTDNQPADVSKALFMDLAFLLIAALVLLVQEPVKRVSLTAETVAERPAVSLSEVAIARLRSVAVKGVVEKYRPGEESLLLRVRMDGTVSELLYDGSEVTLPIAGLATRIGQMPDRNRTVVLVPDKDVPYSKVAEVRDVLSPMKDTHLLAHIYELTRDVP